MLSDDPHRGEEGEETSILRWGPWGVGEAGDPTPKLNQLAEIQINIVKHR